MSFRLTIGLLIVLVLLGGAVYVVGQNPAATPTPATKSIPVLSFLPSDVTELQASGQGKTVVVARGDDARTWLLKQPEQAPADGLRMDSLVSRLGVLTATRSIDSPASLAEFGLERPSVEAKVALKSGQSAALLLGDQTPDKASYYAKLPDQPTVYLVPVALGGDLARLLTNPPKATPTPTPLVVLTPIPSPSPEASPSPAGQ